MHRLLCFLLLTMLTMHLVSHRPRASADSSSVMNNSETIYCKEEGESHRFLDPTCHSPFRVFPFTCSIRWSGRPCKCDQKCDLYDECCLDTDEMIAPERFIYPFPDILPDKMAWEDLYLQYMSCVIVWGIHYGLTENITISASYHLISKCPSHILADSTFRRYCENPPSSEDIFVTPITVSNIGHFKNIYCAFCHGVSLGSIQIWQKNCYCDSLLGASFYSSSQSENGYIMFDKTIQELASYLFCKCILEPPSDIPSAILPRPCFPVDVKTCHEGYSNGTQTKCPSYLAPVEHNGTIYQNLHCAYCNGIDVCKNYIHLCISVPIPIVVQDGYINPVFAEYFSFTNNDQAFAAMSCAPNEAFDPLTNKCQVLYCLSGYEYNVTNEECERVPSDENGRICMSFFHGQAVINMTSLDAKYLAAAVNSIIIEFSLDILAFSVVSSMSEMSCTPTEAQVEENDVCNQTSYVLLCQVCFDVEMDFTSLSVSYREFGLGCDMLSIDPSCIYSPSFGNLSLVELAFSVPAGWNCKSHSSWTFADDNRTFLRPFRVNIISEKRKYVMNVSTIDHICTDNATLVCDKYVILQASHFEFMSNQSEASLRILGSSTFLSQDQFQMQPDGSVVYCLKGAVSAVRNLPVGLDVMSLAGSVLSIISMLVILTTYSSFPALRNLAGRLVLSLSIALLITFVLSMVGGVSAQNTILCKAVAAATHFFWLSIFFWMNALAIDLNRTFGSRVKTQIRVESHIFYIRYSLYAWGTPALIVGVCLIIDLCDCTNLSFAYATDGLCWLSSGNANLFGFGVPLASLLFLNAILFIDTVVGIRLIKKTSERALKKRPYLVKAKEELSLYVKVSSVMGFTWIFAFVCEYANVPELWYIFTAVNSLQGVFILLAFGFNKRIIGLWKEKLGIKRDDVTSSGSADAKNTSSGNNAGLPSFLPSGLKSMSRYVGGFFPSLYRQ